MSDDSVFSPAWYRVAGLRPRVRTHARFHRHRYREQTWYVLQDPTSGRCHRLTEAAYLVVGQMDGERTTQQIWETVGEKLGDDAPTQDETLRLLGMLHAGNLLIADVPPDTEEMLRRSQRRSPDGWRQFKNPLAIRIPMIDPDRWLDRGVPWVLPLFSRPAAFVWCAVVVAAFGLAIANFSDITAGATERLLSPQNLLILWLVYPFVKTIHELGHAFATRVWGGEVHEMGFMLLVLAPIPYVDASSATAFPEKHRRMLVGAAGMLVETFLASMALFVWLTVEPGIVRSIAYNVMFIGTVSTLLVNGNPLLKFDGYYVFADAIEMPNLADRSKQYLSWFVLQRVFGVDRARNPVTAPGEGAWFLWYGVAAFVYRLFVMLGIAFFLASQYAVLGALLAIFAVVSQVVIPLVKHTSFLLTSPRLAGRRPRALAISFGGGALAALLLCALPVPQSTFAEGVVWPPEGAQVRAGADGFVTGVLAASGSMVEPGSPLFGTRDPMLEAKLEVLEAQLREHQALLNSHLQSDRVRAQMTREDIGSTEAAIAHARERMGEVTVRSRASGSFEPLSPQDLEGRFVRQGELLGYVVGPSIDSVRVVIPESSVKLVHEDTRAVKLRLASGLGRELEGRLHRTLPEATDRLPTRALGAAGGGRIDVDPEDEEGLRTADKVFAVDIDLPPDAATREIGTRVYVKFSHGTEPLAARIYRAWRRLFLRQLSV